MTRIILVHETDIAAEPDVFAFEDPRSHREIIKAVNTGLEAAALVWDAAPAPQSAAVRPAFVPARGNHHVPAQWAVSHEPVDTVTVMERRPPVLLTPRQYDVLFGLADGLSVPQIAHRLRIAQRTGYLYLAELKERFGAQSTAQLVARALEENMLPVGSRPG